MIIYYENFLKPIVFATSKLKEAFQIRNIYYLERPLKDYLSSHSEQAIVLSRVRNNIQSGTGINKDGFKIEKTQNTIYVTALEERGLMYGVLDLAENIRYFGIESITSKTENPFKEFRGIKFNLPIEPYDNGDPFIKNYDICLNKSFWKDYIDFLALHRYNCLSLWSENPFYMMFRLSKYPDTCPYSDVELEQYKNVFFFIFNYAKERCIDTYLITWNIRITPFIAKGLGLPPELGYMEDRYDSVYNRYLGVSQQQSEFSLYSVRQHQDVIEDYITECIKTLIMTYRDLTGIGTSNSEEMAGDAEERELWIARTYLKAVKEVNREIPFIHRTNWASTKTIEKIFMDQYPFEEKYYSWKYSIAHMYSHPKPQFEEINHAWDNINLEKAKVIYTVRNDDINTFRWGDCDFIKAYIKGMDKPFVKGFYWGGDGYLWADDFQHFPNGHKTWKYDFERHWFEFYLLGRLGYNPDLEETYFIEQFKEKYGVDAGPDIYIALKNASKIIPAVNRLCWLDFDFEWQAESLLTARGFRSITDFLDAQPMPGINTLSIAESATLSINGIMTVDETALDIINILKNSYLIVEEKIKCIYNNTPKEYMA